MAALDYPFYDADSEIGFNLTYDTDSLHLRLTTRNRFAMLKILRTGLTVHFDTTGQALPQRTAVQYPINLLAQPTRPEEAVGASDIGAPMGIQPLVDQVPPKAVWMQGGTTLAFQKKDRTSETPGLTVDWPFRVTLYSPDDISLAYHLAIPILAISPRGKAGLHTLAMGVESGAFAKPTSTQPVATPQGTRITPEQYQYGPGMGEPFRFWFVVDLSES